MNLLAVRWGVRAVLALGVAASVTANILHAQPNPISQTIAAWPPCALLLTVELISRVPVHRRSLAVGRLLATAVIAGIAAWVSYWHMVGVAARYGEQGAAPYLLPLSVDGLVVVASICLVELAGRIAAQPSVVPAPVPVPVVEPVPDPVPEPAEPARRREPRRQPSPNGSRPATIEDARRVIAEWPDGRRLTRDALADALRKLGRPVSNKRAGDMLDELLPSVPELVPA